MKAKECPRYDFCSAAICPMDEESIRLSPWMPDGEVCCNETFRHLRWVRRQRKISKVVRDHDSIYTCRMLQHDCVVGRAMTGIDPDTEYKDMKKAEDEWLARHPVKHTLTDEEREARSRRLPKLPMGSSPISKGQSAAENE